MLNTANRDAIEQRRLLHAKIARSRRRLGSRTAGLRQGTFLPAAWRRQIQEHPVIALATAAGIGMLLAQLCTRTSAAARTGDWLAQWLAGGRWSAIMKYIESILTGYAPAEDTPTSNSESEPQDG